MKKKFILLTILAVVLISGCASTSRPTSKVGIVNGKYAVKTTVPNNNKGKKVNITMGQSYHCIAKSNDGKQTMSFDLKALSDGKTLLDGNNKSNGKLSPTGYPGKYVHNPKYGFVETTKGSNIIQISSDNSGRIGLYSNKKALKSGKGIGFVCTQTTANTYSNTRYLTDHEIDAYKHGQQIAVQQRSIDSANYNATMSRIQNQNTQMNYNTQQMLNRMNTYNINVHHY